MKICYRTENTGEERPIAKKAYDEVRNFLIQSDLYRPHLRERHDLSATSFGKDCIELSLNNNPAQDASIIIIDQHKGYAPENAEVMIHAPDPDIKNNRMYFIPSGFSSVATEHGALPEVNHGIALEDEGIIKQAYIEVLKEHETGTIKDIVLDFLGFDGFPQAISYYEPVKSAKTWVLEKKEINMPKTPAILIHEGHQHGIPKYMPKRIGAIKEGTVRYNLDIRGVSSLEGTAFHSPGCRYIFQSAKHIRKAAIPDTIDYVFAFTSKGGSLRPYFLGEDAERKNSIISNIYDTDNIKIISKDIVKEIQYAIIYNLLSAGEEKIRVAENIANQFRTKEFAKNISQTSPAR